MHPPFFERIRNRYLLHRYLQPFCQKQLAQRTYTPQNTIALFAQPRSGSTWLAELLNHIPDSIIMNEPLWRGHLQTHGVMPAREDGKVDEVRKLNFYFYQPIPEQAQWPEAAAFFDKLFRGGVCKLGLHELNDIAKLVNQEVFIVKFCYANLLFHWLLARFSIRPIVLMRHPCAVVASQLQHYAWGSFKKQPSFNLPAFPHNDYYLQYLDILKHIQSPEGILAALWAINTRAIYRDGSFEKEWYLLVYEKLYLNLGEEMDRLFSWIQHPFPTALHEETGRPSISTSAASRQLIQSQNPAKHLSRWQQDLSKHQISNIMEVVTDFGVDYYTADSLEPDYTKLRSPA